MTPAARPRRSVLYMPASNAKAVAKARELPCDGVILDLEDAVAPDMKAAAREAACAAVREGGWGGREVVIRVNGLDTEWGAADLSAARTSEDLKRLLRAQVERARDFYRRAETGIPKLADDGSQLTVWIMRHVYAGILEEVERADYEVLHRRVSTSFARKLLLAARAWRSHRSTEGKSVGMKAAR